jgi:hypothetical protein
MRETIVRRTLICCSLVAVTAATLVGCSSDKSSGSSSSSSTVASSAAGVAATSASSAASADPATTKAVTDAYVKFFDGKTPADQKIAVVEKGDALAPVLQAQANNPQGQGTSATVSAVKLTDADHADVTYTLLIGGNPALADQAGKAVQDGGQWKIAAVTVCALMAMQANGAAVPGC